MDRKTEEEILIKYLVMISSDLALLVRQQKQHQVCKKNSSSNNYQK